MPDAPDYYELLGIAPDASDEEIRAAHRRAANYWHPDRNKSPDAAVMMRHVNNARDTLLSATRKQAYNLTSRVYQKWAGVRTGANTTGRDPAEDIRRESKRWEQKARETWEREERKQKARAEQEARKQENARNQSTKKTSQQQPAVAQKPRRRKQASNWAWVGISVMVIVVVSGVLANISSGGIAESALPAPTTITATSTATSITGDKSADLTEAEATTQPVNEIESPEPTQVVASASPTPVVVIGSSVPTSIAGPSLSPDCSMYAGLQFYGPVDGSIISVDGNYKEPILPRGYPSVPDFDASITFTAPLDGLWNFGLVFRRDTEAWDALVISRSQTWTHQVYRNSYVTIAEQGGVHNTRNLPDANENVLRLRVSGSRAYAYLNGAQMASFVLSATDVASNEISPFVFNDIQKPVTVEFKNFTVSCPS